MRSALAGVPAKEWVRPRGVKQIDTGIPRVADLPGDKKYSTRPKTRSTNATSVANGNNFQTRRASNQTEGNGAQAAPPRRRPERVEIPEQLF